MNEILGNTYDDMIKKIERKNLNPLTVTSFLSHLKWEMPIMICDNQTYPKFKPNELEFVIAKYGDRKISSWRLDFNYKQSKKGKTKLSKKYPHILTLELEDTKN